MGEARCAWPGAQGIARHRPTAASSSPRSSDGSGRSSRSAGPTCRKSAIQIGQVRNDIDRFILAGLEAKGIAPAAPADKRTLLRRATFDLIGLPPTPAEIDAFLADDSPAGVRKGRGPAARVAALRRALGAALARRRPLRRRPRPDPVAAGERLPRGLALPRLGRRWRSTATCRTRSSSAPRSPATCCRRRGPDGINKDGLVATGLLAIADFVPGDVDKDQMIADYVNDQIDVVGRAFLGLSVACARCHDHKFDPISTEDYYALAGIFFSTRIIPGPVPGNTPLVRVPLLSPDEIARNSRRRPPPTRAGARSSNSCSPTRPTARIASTSRSLLTGQSARYLVAAANAAHRPKPTPAEVAKQHGLHAGVLAGWVAFLDRIEKHPNGDYPPCAPRRRRGQVDRRRAGEGGTSIPGVARRAGEARSGRSRPIAGETALATRRAAALSADDPRLATDAAGRVTLWPNRAGLLRRTPCRRFRRTLPSRPPRRSATTPSP